MQTVYLQRWTEDPLEDMEAIKVENDLFIDSRNANAESGGLLTLSDILTSVDDAVA